jgi:AraC-like DNA-binding protein
MKLALLLGLYDLISHLKIFAPILSWSYWLLLLYGFLLSIILYSMYRFQLTRRLRQELEEAKHQFHSDMAQTFRTPLKIIIGLTEHLQSQVTESGKENLHIIRRNGQQLLQHINQMQNTSTWESPTTAFPPLKTEVKSTLSRKQNMEKGVHPDHNTEPEFMEQVRHIIQENMHDFDFSVHKLAIAIHYSEAQFYRKVKSVTGASPGKLIRAEKIKRARQLLADPTTSITTVAFRTGYKDPQYFSKIFKQETGLAPSDYRRAKLPSQRK